MVGRPAAPEWACVTVEERERLVHERLSSLHPPVFVESIEDMLPTDISVSVTDVRVAGTWERRPPTIQLEGGSYSVAAAWQLCSALREVLEALGEVEPGASMDAAGGPRRTTRDHRSSH